MLNSMTVGYCKAYRQPQMIEFAQPHQPDGKIGLTVLVGPNNSGKSSFLLALRDLRAGNNNQMIFDQTELHQGQIPAMALNYSKGERNLELKCQGSIGSSYLTKTVEENGESIIINWRGHLIDPILPVVRFVQSRRVWVDTFNSQSRAGENSLDQSALTAQRNQQEQLGQSLRELLSNEQKIEFDNLIKRIIPEMHDWEISRINGQDAICYKTAFGRTHKMSLLGDGFASIFRLAYTLHTSKPGDCIIFDEPELSLHPQAQRRLAELLYEEASDKQIVIATHSPYFVNWKYMSEGAKLYRIFKDIDGYVEIKSITPSVVSRLVSATQNNIKNRKLFDVLAKEVFFCDSVIFTEGQEDVHIIDNYLEQKNLAKLPLFGYGAGGASFISDWLEMASDLGISAVGLYDGDKKDLADTTAKKFSGNLLVKVVIMKHDDIRDKHFRDGNCVNAPTCKETNTIHKPGYFDRHWKIKETEEADFIDLLNQMRSHLA